jgi:hypothetical protein
MDIELKDHRKTVAVMRELAGLRTKVPSHGEGDPQGRPPFRAHELDQLRARVRELAQAIVDGGTMGRSAGSIAASKRRRGS